MYITECLITDTTGSIRVVWFNQPFITKILKQGDKVFFSGKVEQSQYGLQFLNPSYEKIKKEQTHTARIVPVYSLTENLTEKQIRYLIKLILPLAKKIPEWLPEEILKRHSLPALSRALTEIHFPTDKKRLSLARRRLKFDELFIIQLKIQNLRYALSRQRAPQISFDEARTKKFVASLPFTLTMSQKKASWEIVRSMNSEKPMNRLLEGDVGSGKTVVAMLAMLNVVFNKYQTVLMAPTEILAQQHYITITQALKQFKIRTVLLTRTSKQIANKKTTQKNILTHIQAGKAQMIIGTHALIQEKVIFKNLGLVIIDEQHRFGVDQRKTLKLKTKTTVPHLLSMTATPIPRSLAHTVYGNLDISVITQLPSGRKKIITKVVAPEKRQLAYDFIYKEIKKGRQVFVICPLINESDKLGVKAATAEYEQLTKIVFPDLSIGLVHGKLKSQEKETVMDAFAARRIDILVATAVVEVGIDIPNATVMMIEGAERFGLAQLHQFRGRVGRAEHQSYCFVFTDSDNKKTIDRLNALVTAKDGFELAEKDLEFRGPGELYGLKQSGFPELKIAKLTDYELIKKTKEAAEYLFREDPTLKAFPEITARLLVFSKRARLK